MSRATPLFQKLQPLASAAGLAECDPTPGLNAVDVQLRGDCPVLQALRRPAAPFSATGQPNARHIGSSRFYQAVPSP